MALNENYYNKLFDKYSISKDCNRVVELTAAMILGAYNNKNVYFNFPRSYDLKAITNLLYENFSKQIFTRYADLLDYFIGDKFKRNNEKGIYVITDIGDKKYSLKKENDPWETFRPDITYDRLTREYTRVKQSVKNNTLSKFDYFFKDANNFEFLPTSFSKKLVLIAKQTMWNNLTNKNCIPSTYLPNTRDGEQTIKRSIEALEDCIAYVTPKYEVCYEEILKKNIAVDTIIVCDADLNSISQIVQDQSRFNFKLIVLSNESGIQKFINITLWNWQKEEIELLEHTNCSKVEIECIEDEKMDNLIQHFEESMSYVSSLEPPIKLKSYGYFLRLALNALQEEQFDYLFMRLKNNKELERNEGGYEDFGNKNPKEALKNLLLFLKENNPKQKKLKDMILRVVKKTLIVADREDIDCFKTIRNSNCKVITNSELKKLLKNGETDIKNIMFYSFNGSKDFNFIYNLQNNVKLVLHKQEKELYCKQLQIYTKQLEEELTSADRVSVCGIKYEPIATEEIKVSPTLEQIIERLDQRSNTAYDGYKTEGDSLLDDLEEEITYKITMSNGETWKIQSNETVFDIKGNLIKSYRLKENSKIRIYPKDQLAENLLQIAVDVEPDKFGKIDEHSNCWKDVLKSLDIQYSNRETLYQKLKESGLRVSPMTVNSYFRGNRKFPMFNLDLKAILNLANKEYLLPAIKNSKRLYNSTMIALGRGLKQELQQFLQDKIIGEILQKKGFTAEALQQFTNEFMPLLTITKIEEIIDDEQ
ncbi:MAG: hypothetical protein FWD70_00840 [Desulfuromonadales bacterium]|nr:hypothetical protein [Desulfuromonadales bacterium]